MTQLCCATCHVRFSRNAFPSSECPDCGEALVSSVAEQLVGFKLWSDGDELSLPTLEAAIAATRGRTGPRPD